MMFNRINPGTQKVATMKEIAPQMTKFSVDALSSVYMNDPAFYDSKQIDSKTELLTTTDKERDSRIEFYVDPDTLLPHSGTKEYLDGNKQWQSAGRFEIQFNQPIPAGKFETSDLK